MNREEARGAAEVLKAFSEGKEIQMYVGAGGWVDCDDPEFFGNGKFRIKPKPKEIWARYDENSGGYQITDKRPAIILGYTHYREVTEG